MIFLTANDQESDQIRGYEVGAVDYITKPFSIGALLRKIRAMFAMLEHRGLAKDFYDDGRLFLDFSQQSASLNGNSLTLSPMEYKMLYLFCKNPKQILGKECFTVHGTHRLSTSAYHLIHCPAQFLGKYGKPFTENNCQKEHPDKSTEHQQPPVIRYYAGESAEGG